MENNDSTTSLANVFSAVISLNPQLNPHMALHILIKGCSMSYEKNYLGVVTR
jgi:hypothetical protein